MSTDLDVILEDLRTLPPLDLEASSETEDTEDLDDTFDLRDYLSDVGISQQRDIPLIERPWMKYHLFTLVKSVEQVNQIVDEAIKSGRCALDLETQGLDNRIDYTNGIQTVHKIVGYCLSYGNAKEGFYIPVRHRVEDNNPNLDATEVENAIRRLCLASQPTIKPDSHDKLSGPPISPPHVVIEFWNAKFDQEFLYPITGIDWWHPESFEDGLLAMFTLFSGDLALGLKSKAKQLLRSPQGDPYEMIELKELFKGPVKGFDKLPPHEPSVVRYACSDAICTRLLCDHPNTIKAVKSKDNLKFIYRLEKQVTQVVRVLERNRVRIDRERLKKDLEKHTLKKTQTLEKISSFAEARGWPNFDVASTKQLSDFLFGAKWLNIEPKPEMLEKSGQYKTDATTIEEIGSQLGSNAPEILKWIISYRQEEKIISTYLENLVKNPDENNELRFSFKQTGAATGRFSAPAQEVAHGYSGIPIHGIPSGADFRECFIARPGYVMIKSDYAGQELRIVSNVSNEEVWIKEFLEGEGDLHSITARAFFNKQEITKDERKAGKIANFALIYGGGPRAIIAATNCSLVEAQRRKKSFDEAVPTFAKWIKGQKQRVHTEGGVYNAFGRWMAIPDANIKAGEYCANDAEKKTPMNTENAKGIQAMCERHAVNYPIQSTGADIMKISMVMLHKELFKRGWLKNGDDSVRLLLTVHDEIVFEVKHERVLEFVPVMVELMEYPDKLTGTIYSPKWRVPLVTDPLIGPSWGAGYSCARYNPKKKLGEGDVLIGDFVYSTIREVDKGKGEPGQEEELHTQTEKKIKIRHKNPLWIQNHTPQLVESTTPTQTPQTDPVLALVQSVAEATTPQPSSKQSAPLSSTYPPPAPNEDLNPQPEIPNADTVTLRILVLTPRTVNALRGAIAQYLSSQGPVLCVQDFYSGKTLITPRLGLRVDIVRLAERLKELFLSDGKIAIGIPTLCLNLIISPSATL